MRALPFHRRILPWIFFITFLGVAPALVFYTAGYRWNPKKNTIERNGTVIIDSVPPDADIMIDGRSISRKTPYTIQNMALGVHAFEVSKSGYFPWNKSLDVLPQHVTFAHNILLWKRAQPILISAIPIGRLRLSPDVRNLLYVSSSTSTTEVFLFDTRTTKRSTLQIPMMNVQDISWSPNGTHVLLEPSHASDGSWLIEIEGTQQPLQLPPGRYRWENNQLIGNASSSLLTIRISDFSLSRTILPPRRIDFLQGNALVSPTGTHDIAYININQPDHGFLLPPQQWNFWNMVNDVTLLRDGTSWLSLVETASGISYHTAQGDILRPNPFTKLTTNLLVNQNELWVWDPRMEPELMLRTSNPITAAAWHGLGTHIFYATTQDIIALEVDSRFGRLQTPIAHFDRVYDLIYENKKIFILATLGEQTGLWTLTIE